MIWEDAKPLAQAGRPVRRRAWIGSTGEPRIVYVAGAGTTRAVAVYRSAGADDVVTTATFAAADRLADDWEAVP